jgi:hypothetical protein
MSLVGSKHILYLHAVYFHFIKERVIIPLLWDYFSLFACGLFPLYKRASNHTFVVGLFFVDGSSSFFDELK